MSESQRERRRDWETAVQEQGNGCDAHWFIYFFHPEDTEAGREGVGGGGGAAVYLR